MALRTRLRLATTSTFTGPKEGGIIGFHKFYCQRRAHSDQTVPLLRTKDEIAGPPVAPALPKNGLHRLPLSALLRNLMLSAFSTSPTILKLGIALLGGLSESKTFLFNPDRNKLLRAIVKPGLYDHFCAGTNRSEVLRTRAEIKGSGYSGVILCYGKEIQVSKDNTLHNTGLSCADQDREIDLWRDGNLETLDMAGEGDWLGMKLSGAGHAVTEALLKDQPPPEAFVRAIDAICRKARDQNCRLWVDAEQQVLQTAIDKWTIDLMRRYNIDGTVVVYNTIQAYLKQSRNKLKYQLALSSEEGWQLAVKLVRGAYIANDQREKIHDTKADTDASYNGIVQDILSNTVSDVPEHDTSRMRLFLAGHNPESIKKAFNLVQELSQRGKLAVLPDFGQLHGMGDTSGCQLLEDCAELDTREQASATSFTPRVYKCLTWGSIQECMQFLLRRVVENTSAADRMRDGTLLYYRELKRRIFA